MAAYSVWTLPCDIGLKTTTSGKRLLGKLQKSLSSCWNFTDPNPHQIDFDFLPHRWTVLFFESVKCLNTIDDHVIGICPDLFSFEGVMEWQSRAGWNKSRDHFSSAGAMFDNNFCLSPCFGYRLQETGRVVLKKHWAGGTFASFLGIINSKNHTSKWLRTFREAKGYRLVDLRSIFRFFQSSCFFPVIASLAHVSLHCPFISPGCTLHSFP